MGHLADKMGEDRLFIGPAFQQADETAFGWPDLRPITGLAGSAISPGYCTDASPWPSTANC